MQRVGWHLDAVPQPFLTFRRIAFGAIVLVMVGAAASGVLIAYDGIQGRSLVFPSRSSPSSQGVAVLAGGVFGMDKQEVATVAPMAQIHVDLDAGLARKSRVAHQAPERDRSPRHAV